MITETFKKLLNEFPNGSDQIHKTQWENPLQLTHSESAILRISVNPRLHIALRIMVVETRKLHHSIRKIMF